MRISLPCNFGDSAKCKGMDCRIGFGKTMRAEKALYDVERAKAE